MSISDDEARALAFIAGLIPLTVLGRWVDRPRTVLPDAPVADIGELAARSEVAIGDGGGSQGPGVRARGAPPARPKGSVAPVTVAPAAPRKTASPTPENPLDLNRATAAELDRLPLVGPALAARIVAWRDSLGPFRTVEQLDSVRGIGPAMLARIKPLLRLAP